MKAEGLALTAELVGKGLDTIDASEVTVEADSELKIGDGSKLETIEDTTTEVIDDSVIIVEPIRLDGSVLVATELEIRLELETRLEVARELVSRLELETVLTKELIWLETNELEETTEDTTEDDSELETARDELKIEEDTIVELANEDDGDDDETQSQET